MRLSIGIPDVYRYDIGTSVNEQPENGWRGVVAINYAAGWIDVGTRYRWTRAELLAIAGIARRSWIRVRNRGQ